jgi:hypothetical protein
MDNLYILCIKPPACVLFYQQRSKNSIFEDLEAKLISVLLLGRSITIKGYSVQRKQIPICPAFSLTDYKVQGSTLISVILDLKDDPTAKGQDHHKKYCFYICTTITTSILGQTPSSAKNRHRGSPIPSR